MKPPSELHGLERHTGEFDFLIGQWNVHNQRRRSILAGDEVWTASHGEASSTTLHNGAVSVDEMWFPELGFAGMSIRLYTPSNSMWSIYWVSSRSGELQPAVSGRWSTDGSEFIGTGVDSFEGSTILARYIWHQITDDGAVWEQSFSPDWGLTWETNWVMTWTRK